MKPRERTRRIVAAIGLLIIAAISVILNDTMYQPTVPPELTQSQVSNEASGIAYDTLRLLEVKGRAPKTDYSRDHFGDGWNSLMGCDVRNIILKRDLTNTTLNEKCQIVTGTLNDPYTGMVIQFVRGETTSDDVQIDHVVALSDAWQKGAQQISYETRVKFANDPLNLLAVDGTANQAKSNSDAASWLPPNKSFRCQYVARQVAVKYKYELWVTNAELDAIEQVLSSCPGQKLPSE